MLGHRFLKLAIFILYWLGFAPWLVLVLQRLHLLMVTNYADLFIKYTTVFFILLLIYIVIHKVYEYFYLRHKIKKIVRKVTIRHQLERLERGEIDLAAAQRISTFTKIKPPKRLQKKKRKSTPVKKKQPAIKQRERKSKEEKQENAERKDSEARLCEKQAIYELEKPSKIEDKEAEKSPSGLEVVMVQR